MRRIETGMGDRELKKAPGLQYSIRLTEHKMSFRNIHETHEASYEIKTSIFKWQLDGTADLIVNSQWLLAGFDGSCVCDEHIGNIDSRHFGATPGKQARIVSIATADIQP